MLFVQDVYALAIITLVTGYLMLLATMSLLDRVAGWSLALGWSPAHCHAPHMCHLDAEPLQCEGRPLDS